MRLALRGPGQALLWEYARLSRRTVLTIVVTTCALAALYHRAMEPLGNQRDGLVFTSMFSTLLIVYALALISCRSDAAQLGFETRLFRLPWPTWKLVASRLLPAICATETMYLLLAAFMKLTFGLTWPLLGPGLLIAAATSWTLTLVWVFGHRPWLISPVALALIFGVGSQMKPYLKPAADPAASWAAFGLRDATGLVALVAAAGLVAVLGVSRRRSAGRQTSSLVALAGTKNPKASSNRWSLTRRRMPRRQSPVGAHLWREWQEKGRFLVGFTALGFIFNLGLASFPRVVGSEVVRQLAFVAAFAFFALPYVSGFLHGRFHLSSAEPRLDHLRATLPLGDRDLAWLQIVAALRTVGACWLVMAGGAFATLAWLQALAEPEFASNLWNQAREGLSSLPASTLVGIAVVLIVFTLAATGLTASLVLTGRNWLIAVLGEVPIALIIVALVVERIAGVGIWQTLLPILAGRILAGCLALILPIAVLASAWFGTRHRLLGRRVTLRLLLFWFSLSISTILLIESFDERGHLAGLLQLLPSGSGAVAATAFWAAAILPWLLAPLAVNWNRHR